MLIASTGTCPQASQDKRAQHVKAMGRGCPLGTGCREIASANKAYSTLTGAARQERGTSSL